MNNNNNIINKKFYSIDIANSNRYEISKTRKFIKKFVAVKMIKSDQVEPENFYKPISKYIKF